MDNKNDWEEIEKWNIERMEKDKEKFGSYVGDFNHDTKGVDRLVKGLNITGGVFKVIRYIVYSLFILKTGSNIDLKLPASVSCLEIFLLNIGLPMKY